MEVILAKTAGFCMGVGLALTHLDKLVAKGKDRPIYILGPIIHNPQVLKRYADKGVIMVDRPEDVPGGAYVVIRAHGIPRQVEAQLCARDVRIKDATCPRVKKAQLLIADHTDGGGELLLYGEADHPEVAGLVSYAQNGYRVFGVEEELESYGLKSGQKYVLAAQTTQDRVHFDRIAEKLSGQFGLDVTVLETICDATKLRQAEAKTLAAEVDFVVVVGGYNSGNTRRLAQVVSAQGTPCKHVETLNDLSLDSLTGFARIGVTAGASTPRTLINEVLAGLESL
ncbi:4-hydroxy-3-methylbut-2-enyl diphosphate reductase [Pseudodesulfovibrio sp. S3]|uniref:4-hydroxy-3-methylbut-2-enyl diphosphate reductase n=1 Tax=unclassified Pseudodesulfovibrio TaxID=2661612 RepID=UPI000FEB8690|nr:4-hydroxy-3-methylbut-2-enyl diphosphate reductase [Pseudodesulfovibrio sp. S3]MCJ2164498.1 4-hydroxy-3-methylbut-2-enyl diphosphate reductase [Pseudodesulfovibrio sp. S3-i]RWU04696.1 4-hydroxy-3-methylbut-2-enyl diphosphate reductase [Pseudodesulfovibrio sp. S3]